MSVAGTEPASPHQDSSRIGAGEVQERVKRRQAAWNHLDVVAALPGSRGVPHVARSPEPLPAESAST
jgi:hypothetical protein